MSSSAENIMASSTTSISAPSHSDRLVWDNITVTVIDHTTKKPIDILSSASGSAGPGDMVALMGPSGSGKTTLLNVLAHRRAAAKASVSGTISIGGKELGSAEMRKISTYVEQEDSLIGSLTVRETIEYSARLSGGLAERVDQLVASFGLGRSAGAIIGTPVRKGISGGQKRRVSVASQLITTPRILFLDEPTSGLDSTAAFEVMDRVRKFAIQENMIVICSIHQPSTQTFNLFSHLTLLSRGMTVYCGPIRSVIPHFESLNCPIPEHMNPAEFLLDVCNTDFEDDETEIGESSTKRLQRLVEGWREQNPSVESKTFGKYQPDEAFLPSSGVLKQTYVLLRRSWIKSYRDLLAYWIRVAMYLGLAFLMGTVWLRLKSNQESIQPFMNAIFFSGAFMSFMAVAYIPAYIEDLECYRREHANGLYGPTAFMLSNFIIGIPFIFLNTILFSVVTVFLVNFRDDAQSFWKYVMWLFLDLLAAESLVIFITNLVPIFVAALAITAFVNGLWMSVGGFLVSERILNSFWYYTFYWINYQRYVFQGMMFNEFEGRTYNCDRMGDGFQCMYPPIEPDSGKISGTAVLKSLGYGKKDEGLWIGVLIAIIAGMRLLAWLTLKLKR